MTERINLTVGGAEKERYRRLAARAGKSLSEWLREAAREKLAAAEAEVSFDSVEGLREFFDGCDLREAGPEPDWEVHRAIIEDSIGSGASPV